MSDPLYCFRYLRNQFGSDNLPIVPFDHLLELFVKTLDRHPLVSGLLASEIEGTGRQMTDLSLKPETSPNLQEQRYPAEICKDIEIALKGLPYIYTGSNTPKVLRTMVRLQKADNHNDSLLYGYC